MILHEDKDVFVEFIQAAAQNFSIPEVYVEKDNWLTRGLKHLSESADVNQLVFKGGTALSKTHKLINKTHPTYLRFMHDPKSPNLRAIHQVLRIFSDA